jgi:hypothetical protein
MRWGKAILLFQAIVVLIIGLTFLSQLVVIQDYELDIIKTELNQGNNPIVDGEFTGELAKVKQRYLVAAWLLPILAIVEIAIVSRALR